MSFYIVETQDQLSQLFISEECYINVIPLSNNFHPILTEVSLIYYKPKYGKGLILTINHSEGFYLNLDKVKEFLLKHKIIYVLDKKLTTHLLGEEFLQSKVQDINLLSLHASTSTPYIQDCNTNIHTLFEQLYRDKPYLNSIIPICKHYETQECIYNLVQQWTEKQHEIPYYNEDYIKVFYGIEKQGITLDMPVFNENFSPQNPKFNIKDDKIYTQFNLTNFTSRPSNSFNGINFAALNKNNGSRASFIPQNDYLFEFDYDSYHPRILAKLIGYEFTEASVHTHLGKMYFKTEELTAEQYQSSKELTFKQLYGGVFEQYKDIPFFAKVKEYTDKIYRDFNSLGYIELIGGRKLFAQGIENVTPQKLLNYIIQSGETFYNVNSIKNVLRYLEIGKKSCILLYTYDSILLDYSEEDGRDTLVKIKRLMEESGFKVNVSYGKNYNCLKKVKASE
jgi:hypothetical protein